ncbi:ferrous iron transport protein B [Candidatus Margulisiibacteriota bacterium]
MKDKGQRTKDKRKKEIVVALCGNPNSGKTSVFNALTGARQRVANWPGVTVEFKEGSATYKHYSITFVDLPGTYSLTAYSQDEVVTRQYIIEKKPDIIIDVIDTTNLERSLFLATQLMELSIPMFIALNMSDLTHTCDISIDIPQLSTLLGCPCIPTVASKEKGIGKLFDTILSLVQKKLTTEYKVEYHPDVETELDTLSAVIETDPDLPSHTSPRWYALKLLERDQLVYHYFHNRVIWIQLDHVIDASIKRLQTIFSSEPETIIAESRYAFIQGALKETVTLPVHRKKLVSDYIDDFLLHRIFGLPIFLFIMWCIFQLTFRIGEFPMHWTEHLFSWFGSLVTTFIPAGVFQSLLVDGVIAGVGGVLVFLPNILLLFFAIALLEDTGYMARAAFLVDKIMHKIGLHGKSFIPMILGFGCSVPAMMACRGLKSRRDQLTTMLVIPFMSCSAKLPVYVLLIGTFFPAIYHGHLLFGIYLFGVLIALLMAKFLKMFIFRGLAEPFVMELPQYRLPSLKSILIHMWNRAWLYIRKAGTIILLFSVIIWFTSNFPSGNLGDSYAGRFGTFIEPVVKPLGFNQQIGIALTAGFAAKEIVISSLGTLYSVEEKGTEPVHLRSQLQKDPDFTPLTALTLITFVLLYIPCIASVIVFLKESGSRRWTLFLILYTTGLAWIVSFVVYQGGRLLGF